MLGARQVALLILATATLVQSDKVLRRRRAHVVEVESSTAFVESLWESDGIRNEKADESPASVQRSNAAAASKTTKQEKADDATQKIAAMEAEDTEKIERILMGEGRKIQEMSMSFFFML